MNTTEKNMISYFNKINENLTIISILLLNVFFIEEVFADSIIAKKDSIPFLRYTKVKDTLYTDADHILEVNLNEQKIYLHFRDGRIKSFLCSTGDPRLDKGVKTPEGIFIIQNKAQEVYSTQFDSTLMLNWMGFNFNIGFHALLGHSYYKYLGKRVSSHGCIRIKKEDSEYLYRIIKIGTPVFIHSGSSARVIAFTNNNEIYHSPDHRNLIKLAKLNLIYLESGMYLHKRVKLLINRKNLTHSGISIGNEKLIPVQIPSYQTHHPVLVERRLFVIRHPILN